MTRKELGAELKTERLLLRPFRLEDVGDAFEYAGDLEWARFLPEQRSRRDAEAFVARSVLRRWDSKPAFTVMLGTKVIGRVSLTLDHRPKTAELGYEISRKHWGKG